MLPYKLKCALICALLLFLLIILSLLKHKKLALKYTLLWLFTGFSLFLLIIFPELSLQIAGMIGIQSNMNALYIFLIAFIIIILMSLTSIVSKQTDRIRSLAQANAILENRIRKIEERETLQIGQQDSHNE